jgi:hypothetical protein
MMISGEDIDTFRTPIISLKQILHYSVTFLNQLICVLFPRYRVFDSILLLYFYFLCNVAFVLFV